MKNPTRWSSLTGLLVVLSLSAVADEYSDTRLLFARIADDHCEIGLMAADGNTRTTRLEVETCPEPVLVSFDRRTAYAVVEDQLLEFDLVGDFEPQRIAPAPDLDLANYLDSDIETPHATVLEELQSLNMGVRTVGRLSDGTLALHAALHLPFGGSSDYLFEFDSGAWSITDASGCDNWEVNCGFSQLSGSSTEMWSWAEEKLVWHPAVAANVYFARDNVVHPGVLKRHFDIDGVPVDMDVSTFESAHYDTVYTGSLVLRWSDGQELVICDEQCHASVNARFLLAQRFWGGTLEVFDMATGKSVLGELSQAVWVDQPRVEYAQARAEMVTAYQAGDFASMVKAAEETLRARLNYPGGLFNLALAHVLNEDSEAAMVVLWRLLELGVDFGVVAMPEFEPLHGLDDWSAYVTGIGALNKPTGKADVAFQLDDGHFVPEGIAIDQSGTLFLGSIRKGLLTQTLDATETLSDRAGHWSVFGMRQQAGKSIWFASAAVPQFAGAGEDVGKTGLFRLDVDSKEIKDAAILPQFEEDQVLGDLVLAYNNRIYTTDSLTGGVYRYGILSGQYGEIVPRGKLGSPQGLALDEAQRFLYIADYIGGIYRVSLSFDILQKVYNGSGKTDYGIDGMYIYGDELIAIQNGVRPHRVVAFKLSDDGLSITGSRVLASNLPEFDEPTLGTVKGDYFYFVANSHWNRFDQENQLPEGLAGPIILKVSLASH